MPIPTDSIKLDKIVFANFLRMAMKNHSTRKVAKELNIHHMIIWRALNAHENTLNNFIILLEYIHRRTLISYDVIFRRLLENKIFD